MSILSPISGVHCIGTKSSTLEGFPLTNRLFVDLFSGLPISLTLLFMPADGTDGATHCFLISVGPLLKGQRSLTALAALVSAFPAWNCRRPGRPWSSGSLLSTITLRVTVCATPEAMANDLGFWTARPSCAHHLTHALWTEMISQSASVSRGTPWTQLAQQSDGCLNQDSIDLVCLQPNPGSQPLDGNIPAVSTRILWTHRPSILITLFTSYLGECLRLEVARVRNRLGNSARNQG